MLLAHLTVAINFSGIAALLLFFDKCEIIGGCYIVHEPNSYVHCIIAIELFMEK